MENESKKIDEPIIMNQAPLAGKFDYEYFMQTRYYLESLGYDTRVKSHTTSWVIGILILIILYVAYSSDERVVTRQYTVLEQLCDRLSSRLPSSATFQSQCMVIAQDVFDKNN